MKKLAVTFLVLGILFFAPGAVLAQEEECVQVQVYGGGVGVVCGAKTHEPVPADFAGIDPSFLGAGLMVASGSLVYLSRKFSRR